MNVADGSETVIEPPETDGPNGPECWYPYSVTWSPDGTTLLYSAWSQCDVGTSPTGGSPFAWTTGGAVLGAETPTNVTVLTDSSSLDGFRLRPPMGPGPDVGPATGMMLTPSASRRAWACRGCPGASDDRSTRSHPCDEWTTWHRPRSSRRPSLCDQPHPRCTTGKLCAWGRWPREVADRGAQCDCR